MGGGELDEKAGFSDSRRSDELERAKMTVEVGGQLVKVILATDKLIRVGWKRGQVIFRVWRMRGLGRE